jgi:hypothetical protein
MSTTNLSERVPYAAGTGAGVGAYLLGYLVTYVTMSGSVEERLSAFNFVASVFGGEPISVWQGVGWLFYNAHFVRTRAEGGLGGPQSENFIAASDGGAIVLLYLVPVLLLLAAGVLLARVGEAEEPADGATAGAGVVLGYFPLALVGAFLFSYQGNIAPDIVTALLLAGIVYPLVFGAIGGAVGPMIGGD